MIVLGINDSHDASACIVKDGKLVIAIGEERVQRVKGTAGFPIGAITECLDYAGLNKNDIDIVAFGSKYITPNNIWNMSTTLTIHDHLKLQEEYYLPRKYENSEIRLKDVFPNYKPKSNLSYPIDKVPFVMTDEVDNSIYDDINTIRVEHTKEILGVSEDKIRFYDHHLCHAKYAYYESGKRGEDVIVVTADAGGDGAYSTIFKVINGEFIELHRERNNLIGKIYSSITLLLGMKPNEHEYKVMGLAPYASEFQKIEPRKIFDKSLKVDKFDFIKDDELTDHFEYFRKRLKGFRFDGISGAIQDFVEDRLSEWFENIYKETGIKDFIYSGGVSNNIKANKSIVEKDFIESFFVPAGPSDENLSIGAAYNAFNEIKGIEYSEKHIKQNENAYWGPAVTNKHIDEFSNDEFIKNNFQRIDNCDYAKVAKILSDGEIIAVCTERMEFGSRALGHRSLIADPSNPNSLKKINDLIKKRDFWMPFTPSIIDHQYDNYVVNEKDLPTSYMTMSFDTTDEGSEKLISAIHPYDHTVRPQKVTKDVCHRYYKLIDEFYKKSGVGAVLNTSLNIHGKPIVMYPIDIVNEILKEDIPLNFILINDTFFIRK